MMWVSFPLSQEWRALHLFLPERAQAVSPWGSRWTPTASCHLSLTTFSGPPLLGSSLTIMLVDERQNDFGKHRRQKAILHGISMQSHFLISAS